MLHVDSLSNASSISSKSPQVSSSKSKTDVSLKFPESKQNDAQFKLLLKEAPLKDEIPTSKWLKKHGYKDISNRYLGSSAGHSKWYEDSNGNIIRMTAPVNKDVIVEYCPKNSSFMQTITYDPFGNAQKCKIYTTQNNTTQTYEYYYDIKTGKPVLDNYIETK